MLLLDQCLQRGKGATLVLEHQNRYHERGTTYPEAIEGVALSRRVHEVTVFVTRKVAGAARVTGSRMWGTLARFGASSGEQHSS